LFTIWVAGKEKKKKGNRLLVGKKLAEQWRNQGGLKTLGKSFLGEKKTQ